MTDQQGFDYFRLSGRVTAVSSEAVPGNFIEVKAQTLDAKFSGDEPGETLLVTLALENLAGMERYDDKWMVMESSTTMVLQGMGDRGFACEGVLQIQGESEEPPVRARALYLLWRWN